MCSVYQLRAVLRGVSPLVWRRLLVRSDISLGALHGILQVAMAGATPTFTGSASTGRLTASRGSGASTLQTTRFGSSSASFDSIAGNGFHTSTISRPAGSWILASRSVWPWTPRETRRVARRVDAQRRPRSATGPGPICRIWIGSVRSAGRCSTAWPKRGVLAQTARNEHQGSTSLPCLMLTGHSQALTGARSPGASDERGA